MTRAPKGCTCDGVTCDEEGDPGCSWCQALDPEMPCPAETDAVIALRMKRGIQLTTSPIGRMNGSAKRAARDGVRAAMSRAANPATAAPEGLAAIRAAREQLKPTTEAGG